MGYEQDSVQRNLPGNLVTSTLLFSFLQVLWQVPFLTWHIYCICCNIKTEEWQLFMYCELIYQVLRKKAGDDSYLLKLKKKA
ncbi:hypothetical protein IEQ34_008616 [Dendrobium chrysotoxum]|uniref:Uncharacterized protein n=1 Tax=Dendrobium chrysotoxum TaxID=161865 RepID=A0AAV7GWD3_DENCH|nr:hypothetical protein IEQ34_008616 [Dendrobium chrysotoxum]